MTSPTNTSRLETELLNQRTRELQTLVRVAQLINVVDLDYVLSSTMQLLTEAVGAGKGSLFLVDENTQPVQRFITQRDLPPEMTRQVAHDVIQKGFAGWCVRHKKGDFISEVSQDKRWHQFEDDKESTVQSALCVPIMQKEIVLGVITLVSSQKNDFNASDLQLVEAIANQASTAIRNARLFDSLQSKQRQLELVIQSNSEALLTITPNFTISVINPQAYALLNHPMDNSLIGTNLSIISQDTIFETITKQIQSAKQTGQEALNFELYDESQERDYSVKISPLSGNWQNNTLGYVIMIHDVTSIKDLNRLKSQMLQVLTHDLKNPLNIILGYTDLIRIDLENNKPIEMELIEGILRTIDKMQKLIEETLNAERLMETKQASNQFTFSPEVILFEAIETLQQLAVTKNLTIKQHIQADMPDIVGSNYQLREAMINLLSNAIKYTHPNGTITINAGSISDRFQFSVEDTGIGIPEDLQDELFSKFYRAPRPELRDIDGTGLGLNLVKSIIEGHHGEVWFKSKPNQGSIFGFWIPLVPPED